MRIFCFFFVVLCLFFPSITAKAQIPVVIVEPCPNDETIASIGTLSALVSAGVTIAGKTTTSDTLRGLSFMIGGIFVFAVHEPEDAYCFNTIDMIAVGCTVGGALGLILSWINHALVTSSPTTPKYVLSWQKRLGSQIDTYKSYAMPKWDLNLYRRGLRLTYRF